MMAMVFPTAKGGSLILNGNMLQTQIVRMQHNLRDVFLQSHSGPLRIPAQPSLPSFVHQ